ncbi:energy-coupling factor transporter transmembrane component T [Actinoplanes sp. NPDC051346]|uniref:energy-coupling factor transporter transmembrane component T n=1 Tax=Actinoplanes sp. NPDC051346 TaxID=3155048 RepID=UPI003436C855
MSLLDLRTYNPLSKLFGTLPLMVLVIGTRDLRTPAVVGGAALLLILTGARPTGRTVAWLLLGVPAALAVMTVSFGVWTDPARVSGTRLLVSVGGFELWSRALETGLATGLRLVAVMLLALVGGLTTTGPDLVRSMIRQLRVPYRIGYSALAAFRFVPRFRHELDVIRSAHRVRGLAGGGGPISGLRRYGGYAVPLLAGGIRHAERVSLAMESRAFGAHPTRTERYVVPFRVRDAILVSALWCFTLGVFA